ncbi:hypothetical protein MTsPCn3_28810 [Erythrobacter sp. MTPC3]
MALSLVLAAPLTGCDTPPADPYAAAQGALADGSPRIALEYATEALKADPANAELRMFAGDVAMALGNPDRAITEYKHLTESEAATPLVKAKLTEAYVAGNYLQAAGDMVQSLDFAEPLSFTAAIGLDMAKGEYTQAYDRLTEGLAAFPSDPRLVTIDAQRLWSLSRRDEARARLAPVLVLSETVTQAHLLAGQMDLAQRAPKSAAKHFEKVLAKEPMQQTALLAMAAIARDRGDDEEATAWIERASASGFTHPVGMLFLAQMAYDGGDIQKAYELIEQVPPAIASAPDFARLRGFIDAARGQNGAAILALKGYIEDTGGDILSRRVLAQSYLEGGEVDSAWEAIEPAIADPQADGGTLLMALDLAKQSGRGNVAAIKAAIARRDAAPNISEPMRKAGDAIRAGNWAQADAIYAPLLEGNGRGDPALLNNAAAVKTKLGEHAAAVALARRAYELAPESPVVLDTLGWALWQKGGAKSEARALLTQARRGAPTNREIIAHWVAAHEGTQIAAN